MRTFTHILESAAKLDQFKMNDQQLKDYNEKMEKGLRDKIFFLDHITDFDLLVDYGCANGALLKAVRPYEPEADFVGYDISEDMLSVAKENISDNSIMLTSDWDIVKNMVAQAKTSLVTINSLIHEVYSYAEDNEIDEFWYNIFNSGFTYISIRDMMMREKDFNKKLDNAEELREKLLTGDNGEEKVESFEDIYGPIDSEGKLIHLLMKWNYWDNWQREVNEDYLKMHTETFFRMQNGLHRGKYKVVHWEPFTLPYLKNYVKDLINWEIKSPTHIKMLLRKI